MPARIVEREMSAEERQLLGGLWQSAPGLADRLRRGVINALLLWLVSTLVLLLMWRVLAWGAREIFRSEIAVTDTIDASIALACATFAVLSTLRWVRGWPNRRPLLQADLDAGRVAEEHYRFVSAKRFQEPEHGGLVYFLHTHDGRVMVFFDHESQDRGTQGQDPLGSSFKPHTELLMVRALHSRWVFDKRFSGEPLEAGEPAVLTLDPKHWPDSEEYCELPWEELDVRLSSN
jgi:hypothetical protein